MITKEKYRSLIKAITEHENYLRQVSYYSEWNRPQYERERILNPNRTDMSINVPEDDQILS